MTHARALTALALILAAFAAIAALLLPNPGADAAAPAAQPAPRTTAPAVEGPHAGGTAVSSTLDDAGFLADLFDGAPTDALPMPVADLIALAHRTCDLPNRAGYVSALAADGWTASEAGKLLDTAAAAYCPEQITLPAPVAPVVEAPAARPAPMAVPAPAAPAPVVTPAPVAVQPAPAPVIVEQPAAEAPVAEDTPAPAAVENPACAAGEEWQGEFGCVAVQLPGETIGRADGDE